MSLTPRDEAIVRHGLQRGYFTHEDVRRALSARPAAPLAALVARLDPRIVAELSSVGVSSTFDGVATQGDAPAGPTRTGSTRTSAASAAAPAAGRQAVVEAYRAERARDPFFAPHADVVLERRGEVGSGGMGVLWRVVDHRLGREVAKKELRGDASPARARRFLREARITAGLDHPSIPPVHEYGTDTAGRPYLLMRLIGGQTLSKELQRFHGRRGRRAVSRSLLEALVKVSEAVAYAHSRGIVHRDLKPDNVMVGEFGEVMVLDWGVARELSRADEQDDATALIEAAPGEAPLTQQGAMVGTPGYMAPEQARGQPVEARADVFALGGILTAILTGEPAVTGEGLPALLHALAEGRLELPRDRWPDAPAELHDLAAAALALDVNDRPTAAQLARDLKAYLAGEPVSVHRYRPLERAGRFARRRPILLIGALAGVLLAAIASGLFLVGAAAERTARVGARETAAREAQAATMAALAELEQAQGRPVGERTALALRALGAALRWRDAARVEPSKAALDAAGEALGAVAVESQQWDLAREAHALLGDEAGVARVEAARVAESRRRRDEVEGTLRRLLEETRDRPGEVRDAVFALARYPERQTVELVTGALDGVSARLERGETPRARERVVVAAACQALGRLGLPEGAVPALTRYLDAETDELRAVPAGLALARLGTEEAIDAVHAARDRFGLNGPFSGQVERGLARRGGAAQLEAETALGYGHRAERRSALGDHQGAIDDYTRALALQPRLAGVHGNRGVARQKVGDMRGALDDYTRALELTPGDALLHANRGSVRHDLGDAPGALEDLSRALELDPRCGHALITRAVVRLELGDPRGAVDDCTRAIEIEPRHTTAHYNRASARQALGDHTGAIEDCTRALALDPACVGALYNRGSSRQALGDLPGAIEDYGRALALDPGHVSSLVNRSGARRSRGDLPGAIDDATRALEHDPRSTAALTNRACAHNDRGAHTEAIADCDRALQVDARCAAAYNARAFARNALGDRERALVDCARAIELAPDDASTHYNRAAVRHAAGDLDGALADYGRALELLPDDVALCINRGAVLYTRGDLAGAARDWTRAVELDPGCASAYANRAIARLALGDRQGAIADLERFLALAPDDPQAPAMRRQLDGLR